MDEILHSNESDEQSLVAEGIFAEPSAKGIGGKIQQIAGAVLAGTRTLRDHWYRLEGARAERKHISPIPFLLFAGAVGAALIVGTVYTQAYTVTVDGVEVGVIADTESLDRAVAQVERRVASILESDYTLEQDVETDLVLAKREDVASVGMIETYLFNNVDNVYQSYLLTVDGQVIGAGDEEELNALLIELAAAYTNESTIAVDFESEIETTYQYIPANTVQDLTQIREILSSDVVGETTYEVVQGDTYSEIANNNGMYLAELMEMNPQASLDTLNIGDILTIQQATPVLSVRTVDVVSYTEPIAYTTEEVEDSSMYVGSTKVLTEGVNGETLVNANVTLVNGREISREITSSVTSLEPVTEVVAVGTKERPVTVASGNFSWPLSGTITSPFGYRTIFGGSSFHSGLDIAAPYGTSIAAADGGTVTWSGYYGTYGNYVVIDHGNGIQTYYAHCSSLLVSVGDKVYKGQVIARVGSTGRSTGNHCHFEVRRNGTAVNPLNYLP